MIQKLSERFDQLSNEISSIDATRKTHHGDLGVSITVDDELLLTWKVKVKNLLVAACGNDSQHYQEFIEAEKITGWQSNHDAFKRMKAVFAAAMEDYKGGFLTSVKTLVQAEVFGSELEQAQELHSSGYKLASAVVAGVVRETALRDLCSSNGIAN